MRVLVAPQEFKGTLTAIEVSEAIATALRAAFPAVEVDLLPMADGGPGTAAAMIAAARGEQIDRRVHDPLMRPIEAAFVRLATGEAVIECAAASGLARLLPDELDPLRSSTFGTGELVASALDLGCDQIIIGLGGSATNDGGAGLAQSLGFRLLDADGNDLPPGGAALRELNRIDSTGADRRIAATRVIGATDVSNPLCGPLGAAAVFGPQKGASAVDVARLDAALAHYAKVLRRDVGVDVMNVPGAGAAGGLGAGLLAFLKADLRPGAEFIAQTLGLERHVRTADVVITGEGRLDSQTAYGKAPQHVARVAWDLGRPVVFLAGSLGSGNESVGALARIVEVCSEDASLPDRDTAIARVAAAAVRAMSRLLASGIGAG